MRELARIALYWCCSLIMFWVFYKQEEGNYRYFKIATQTYSASICFSKDMLSGPDSKIRQKKKNSLSLTSPFSYFFSKVGDFFFYKSQIHIPEKSPTTLMCIWVFSRLFCLRILVKNKIALFSENQIQSALIPFGSITLPSFTSANTVVTTKPCQVFWLLLFLSSTLALLFLAWSYNIGKFQMLSHSRIRHIRDWFTSKSKYEEVHSALSWPRSPNDWAT